ncbi:phosphatidylserine decarboxylase [Deinococcus sp. HMF7604]|uniref:phosphatidylserine decarboxylase n=1 Tax=Deinococcus betulae TaxID=2873312 RepID=UPI001CCD6D82|nr:phosphatidylserine decarboxylase [Deinococcus betulae]MBZ9751258.1 phosphatidylserine decarboxylase [Deinococcus betulae]
MRARFALPLLAAAAAGWYLRSVYRFRDPVRLPPPDAGAVLSPADGVVCFVRRVEGGLVTGEAAVEAAALLGIAVGDGWLLGFFVGPLDVHYAYQPVTGQLLHASHTGARVNVPLLGLGEALGLLTGRPADLLARRGTLENERMTAVTRTAHGDVTLTLVAPGAGLHGTSFVRAGDEARAGHKAAFLAEGGLALLHLPAGYTPAVNVGDRVQGAQSVAARQG